MARLLTSSRRPLRASEARLVRSKVRRLTAERRRVVPGFMLVTAGTMAVLWLATILASDTPWPFITLFWIVVGGGFALWIQRDAGGHARQLDAICRGLESALRRSAADVYEIRATAFAEVEEFEDEGACYAFALDGERLVFITGQEFYRSATFPTLDFSLVYVLDEQGRTVDMFLEKRGSRAQPARTIPAAIKQSLDELPEHLEVRRGTIDDLERVLAGSGGAPR